MSEEVPPWICNAFLEGHLQRYFKNPSIRVVKFDISPAVAKNQNFNSSMHRVKITFTGDEFKFISVLVKEPMTHQLISRDSIFPFDKEGEIYQRILPKINHLTDKLNEETKLLPEFIGIGPNKAILMEDLSVKGYKVISKLIGFNLNEAKKILRKAATFHAACVVLQERQPDIFDKFKYGFMNPKNDTLDFCFITNYDAFCDLVNSMPELEHFTEKLRKSRNRIKELIWATFEADQSHFNTLAHGDLWLNNILVHSDESDPQNPMMTDILFIDFQFSCWTSPAIDLHYFFHTSLQDDVRRYHIDDLVKFYHTELVTRLEQLKYKQKIPNYDEFYQQFISKSFMGFFASCMLQPLIYNENFEGADYETMMFGTKHTREVKYRIYNTPRVKNIARRLLPYFDELGIFD